MHFCQAFTVEVIIIKLSITMCIKVNSEEINAEVKKVEEVIKKIENTSDTEKEVLLETKEAAQKDSCQAIGHVPLPGSGVGKGTGVKK